MMNTKPRAYTYVLFLIYALMLFSVVFAPTYYRPMFAEDEFCYGYALVQPIPFYTIKTCITYRLRQQLFGNVILLMPFTGFLYIFSGFKIKGWKAFLYTVFASAFIELVQHLCNQLPTPLGRVCDIDDLILNSFGGLLIVILT